MVVQVEIFQNSAGESNRNYIKINALTRDFMNTIHFGDEGRAATRELLARFDRASGAWTEFVGADRIGTLQRNLAALEALDRQYGSHGPLALEGIDALVAAALVEIARIVDAALAAHARTEAAAASRLILALALWAIRHDVPITPVEPVVNALAEESNRARSRQDLAAAFGLMQGLIGHVAPVLSGDLERSNPERPWRLLHVNFAITAIRTEDPDMMEHAFDALEAALPDERAGFFAEALALALSPGVKDDVRERIGRRHRKWTEGP
jgi:hypothetical protein